jgi:hypothetical protein
VHAGTAPRFENDYRRIAETVKVPGYKDPKADILRLVHAWLNDESNGRWVMVIDNADDVNVFFPEANTSLDRTHSLLDYIPQSWNGSVLLTSRNQDLAQILTGTKANVVEVAPMDTADGLLLLHNRLGGDFDEQSAAELLRLLDNMPLAITQAAAYIQRHAPRMTIQRYIDELRKGDQSRASLLRKDIKDIRRDGKASNSIMETWNITFELLRQDRPSAARLLSLMSHFDRQSIPEFLLHGRFWGAQHLATDQNDLDEKVGFGLEESFVYKGKSIEQTTNITAELDDNQEDSFEEDIHTLISYSLVKVSDTGDTFEMHRLVQFSTKQWLELHRELEEWKVIYANLLHNVFPLHPEPKDWPTCHILFPHLQASIASRPEAHHALENWASVLYKGGWYANEMENSEIAKEMLGHALKAAKDTVGADDTTTLNIISELGTAVVRLNNLEEAESMHRQVLETRMRILGPEHRDTVLSMKNIALVLRRQKRLQEAEELQVKGMNILKRVLGHEAPETIDLMASLAITYGTQGRFRDEEVLERQVLELSRKTMGNLHRDTLTSMHNLANTLKNQGRVGEAISMMSTCLELREKVIGVQHPFTISSRKIVQELEQVVSQSKEEGG